MFLFNQKTYYFSYFCHALRSLCLYILNLVSNDANIDLKIDWLTSVGQSVFLGRTGAPL